MHNPTRIVQLNLSLAHEHLSKLAGCISFACIPGHFTIILFYMQPDKITYTIFS